MVFLPEFPGTTLITSSTFQPTTNWFWLGCNQASSFKSWTNSYPSRISRSASLMEILGASSCSQLFPRVLRSPKLIVFYFRLFSLTNPIDFSSSPKVTMKLAYTQATVTEVCGLTNVQWVCWVGQACFMTLFDPPSPYPPSFSFPQWKSLRYIFVCFSRRYPTFRDSNNLGLPDFTGEFIPFAAYNWSNFLSERYCFRWRIFQDSGSTHSKFGFLCSFKCSWALSLRSALIFW